MTCTFIIIWTPRGYLVISLFHYSQWTTRFEAIISGWIWDQCAQSHYRLVENHWRYVTFIDRWVECEETGGLYYRSVFIWKAAAQQWWMLFWQKDRVGVKGRKYNREWAYWKEMRKEKKAEIVDTEEAEYVSIKVRGWERGGTHVWGSFLHLPLRKAPEALL